MKQTKNKNILAIIFFVIFLVFLFDVVISGFFFTVDRSVNESMVSLRSPLLTSAMVFFTEIGNYYFMIVLFLVLLVVLFILNRKKSALLLSVSMAAGWALSEVLKFAVQRTRPQSTLLFESGYSFPSQHAMMSAIFFLVLLYSFKEDIKNNWLRLLFILANVFMFLVIGFSRVYLGVHWTSDVIGGWALGIALVNFIIPKFFKKP